MPERHGDEEMLTQGETGGGWAQNKGRAQISAIALIVISVCQAGGGSGVRCSLVGFYKGASMSTLRSEPRRHRLTVTLATLLSLFGLFARATGQSPTGGVSGTIRLIMGDHTVPLVGGRLEVSYVAPNNDKHEAVTDKNGQYAVDLPEGTYKMHLFWQGGDCSIVRRPPFRLSAGEHLNFDFVIMHCPYTEGKSEVPYEEGNDSGFKSMNVPFTRQGRRYSEQLIPAERDHWPEIIVSFGKYDNQVDEIRYFPMYQRAGKAAPATAPILALGLPVTVTVDRYTLQAMEVVLDNKAMVFTAKSNVLISDGKSSRMGNYATLSFSAGQPRLKMEH